jgi:hypothetical protein
MNWAVEWHTPRAGESETVSAIADSLTGMALHGIFAEHRPRRQRKRIF